MFAHVNSKKYKFYESQNKMSKVIVLTGAGGVICSTLAKSLAKEGHKIAVLDLRIDAA